MDSLQSQIDNASPGSTVKARTDCIYRERLDIRKSITLHGQLGAEIRGSDVWTDWTKTDSVWVSSQSVPTLYTHGTCASSSNGRCRWSEQVFMNGDALFQQAAGTTPTSGEFALNSSRQIVLADDPSGQTVEVTTRTRWVVIEADNVTVEGFTMRHSAVDAQAGAIEARNTANNALIKNNALSDAHGAVVGFSNVSNGQLLDNDIYNGGQLGLFANNVQSVVIDGNLIHHNNTEEFSTGWEAGALKIIGSTNTVFSNNVSSFNSGPGYWCDIGCAETIVSHNTIHHNTGIGINYEISEGGKIYENNIWENKWGSGGRTWAFEAGILLSSSRNNEVYNNRVAWQGDGIGIISQCRASHPDSTCNTSHPRNLVDNNYIHDNIIIMEDDPLAAYNVYPVAWARDIKDELGQNFNYIYSPEANNRGANNAYWIPLPERSTKIRFFWNNSNYSSLVDFNTTPAEENGYYLSSAEKNSLLMNYNMPSASEDHSSPRPAPEPILASAYASSRPRANPIPVPEPIPDSDSDHDPHTKPISEPVSIPAQNSDQTISRIDLAYSTEEFISPKDSPASTSTHDKLPVDAEAIDPPSGSESQTSSVNILKPLAIGCSIVAALGVAIILYQKRT